MTSDATLSPEERPSAAHAGADGPRRPVVIVVASVLLVLLFLGQSLFLGGFVPLGLVGLALGVGGALLWRAVGAAMDRVMGVVLPALIALLVVGGIGLPLVGITGFVLVLAAVLTVLCAYGLFAGTRAGWVGTIAYVALNVALSGSALALGGVFVEHVSDLAYLVLSVLEFGGYVAVILLVTLAQSARKFAFGEPARLATPGDQPASEPARQNGAAQGGIALALSMVGFIGWSFCVLGVLVQGIIGEPTPPEQARANLAFTAGVTLSVLGPLGALALGKRARMRNGSSPSARGLGLAAIVLAVIQLVVDIAVVALIVVSNS